MLAFMARTDPFIAPLPAGQAEADAGVQRDVIRTHMPGAPAAALERSGIPESALAGPFPVGEYAAALRGKLRSFARVQIVGELVNVRVSVWGAAPELVVRAGRDDAFAPGARVAGPTVCALGDSTLFVPDGWSGEVDERGTFVLVDRLAHEDSAALEDGA